MHLRGVQTWFNYGWPWPTFIRSFAHAGLAEIDLDLAVLRSFRPSCFIWKNEAYTCHKADILKFADLRTAVGLFTSQTCSCSTWYHRYRRSDPIDLTQRSRSQEPCHGHQLYVNCEMSDLILQCRILAYAELVIEKNSSQLTSVRCQGQSQILASMLVSTLCQ